MSDIYLFMQEIIIGSMRSSAPIMQKSTGWGGSRFAVVAPSARSVSVDRGLQRLGQAVPCHARLGSSGLEILIPGSRKGNFSKFQIKTQRGFVMDQADPYGAEMEIRPRRRRRVNFLPGI